MQAKDLTKDYPRSPMEVMGGFPWLARLIDKVRALNAGTLGEYVAYPCGGDKRFLATFGVDTDALRALIDSGASDDEIATWVEANATIRTAEAFAAYQAYLDGPNPNPEYNSRLQQAKDKLLAERPDLDLAWVDNFTKLILAEEGHPVPQYQH